MLRVKRLAFLLLFLIGFSFAQQKLANLIINGQTYEDAGSYYFAAYGNTRDAYAKAEQLADSLGLGFSYNKETDLLEFRRGDDVLRLETTENIENGLLKQANVLQVNDERFDSPLGIAVEDEVYIAISPVIDALGGESDFDYQESALVVTIAPRFPDTVAPTPAQETPAQEESEPIAALSSLLEPPRVGSPEEGVSRVVIDLPTGSRYELTVADDGLLVRFPNLSAPAFDQRYDADSNIASLHYRQLEGISSLIVRTAYPLSAEGVGYRVGRLAASEDVPHDRLFIDLAPGLIGAAVASTLLPTVEPLPEATNSEPDFVNKIVVIDAGHGAKDPGTVNESINLLEKQVVLPVSLKLKTLLEQAGVNVIMSREEDVFLELDERAEFANPNTNLFVSVHANAGPPQASGIETFVFGVPLSDATLALAIRENGGGAVGEAITQEAINFANSVSGQIIRQEQLRYSTELAETVQTALIKATGAIDRGVKQNSYVVLRKARTPAILVELGFVSNPEEGGKLATDSYQTLLAEALADGILTFLDQGGLRANNP